MISVPRLSANLNLRKEPLGSSFLLYLTLYLAFEWRLAPRYPRRYRLVLSV